MLKAKRLMLASLVMFFFLPFVSAFNSNPNSNVPFISVVFAGHSVPGGFACECGCPDCICDQGEMPGNCGSGATARSSQPDAPGDAEQDNLLDPAAGVMILASLFFLWARLRY